MTPNFIGLAGSSLWIVWSRKNPVKLMSCEQGWVYRRFLPLKEYQLLAFGWKSCDQSIDENFPDPYPWECHLQVVISFWIAFRLKSNIFSKPEFLPVPLEPPKMFSAKLNSCFMSPRVQAPVRHFKDNSDAKKSPKKIFTSSFTWNETSNEWLRHLSLRCTFAFVDKHFIHPANDIKKISNVLMH